MPLFRSPREVRRAQRRMVGWFFAVMAIVTVTFALIVAVHYVLGWW